jgi:RNA polymerase sigma-70 factor (ECF subfamily)
MNNEHEEIIALFEHWYVAEMPRLFRYVMYRVRDQAAAEELTASICEVALNHLHRYQPGRGDLNGWLYGIARNVLKQHFRTQSRRAISVPLEMYHGLHAPGQSPEQAVEMIEHFRQAVRGLRDLPDQEQEVIGLRYGAELSNQEIAEVMGLNPNHVGVLLHRALKKLRQTMQAGEGA